MKQTSLNFEGESQALSSQRLISLPKDKDLPPIISEIVTNAPQNRKTESFISSIAPLCAIATRVRLQYYYDTRPSALLLQVLIEGAQSSGKSFAADIERLIMDKTLKLRDKAMRRQEQEYRDKRKRRKANEKLEEEPETTIRVVPPTISKTVLTKRADMYDRVYGDTLTFWMFAEELAQVTDAGKNGYSNLRTIMRTAYDLNSKFGIDFASDNSYSAIVDINICSMFCATPSAIDDYFDKKAIEGGNITRTILCRLNDVIGEDGAIFMPYTPEQQKRIDTMLNRLMNRTYNSDGGLEPTVMLDTQWLDRTVCRWVRDKAKEASITGSQALDVFRKRSSVSAFRVAALCQYLYELDNQLTTEVMQKRVRQIYLFMADYILKTMLDRWGKRFEELNTKRAQENKPGPRTGLFDLLTETFNRAQLRAIIDEQGKMTPDRIFLCQWKKMHLIEEIEKDTFRKLKKGGQG